jgi:hypothetical protein
MVMMNAPEPGYRMKHLAAACAAGVPTPAVAAAWLGSALGSAPSYLLGPFIPGSRESPPSPFRTCRELYRWHCYACVMPGMRAGAVVAASRAEQGLSKRYPSV